jgi:MFS family permease
MYLPTILAKGAEKKIDFGGAFLIAAGLAALLLVLSLGGDKFAWSSLSSYGLFGLAVAFLGYFIYREGRHEDPIIPLMIFRNGIFRVSVIMLFLVGIAMFGAIIYLPLFAQVVQGASATNSGIILLPLVFSLALTSIASGQVVARTGRYKAIAILGAFLMTGSLFWLSTITAYSSHLQLIIRMIPLGVGIGITMPLFTLIIQNAFEQKLLGVVSSSAQLFRGIGSIVGVALMGTYLNHQLNVKLQSLNDSPFVQTMAKSGHPVTNLNANGLQQLISPTNQTTILGQIAKSPEHSQLTSSFYSFIETARGALATSLTKVFFVSACVLIIACVTVFFLKEIPLRKHNDQKPLPIE